MKDEQRRQMGAERLRPMMQLRDTREIERLRWMGIDWGLMKDILIIILTILPILTIFSVAIALISMGGSAASFGLAYLFALVFLGMMGLLIYELSRDGRELIPTIVSMSVTIVLISMGEYAVYFGCLLVLVLLGTIGFIYTLDGGNRLNELILLTLFTIVNVAIVLILMGGYAASFGYLLALIFLLVGGFSIFFVYTYTYSRS